MKLEYLNVSPYFVPSDSIGDYEVNYDYLHSTHGENAILEFDKRAVMAIEEAENDYRIVLFGGVSVLADPLEEVEFEIVVRTRSILDRV